MTIHTYVMTIGGIIFSFYMKINGPCQFSFGISQFLLCARALRPT